MNCTQRIKRNVRQYREIAEMSVEVLAAKIYEEPQVVIDIEDGREVKDEWYVLLKIAEVLKVTYGDLFEGENGEVHRANVTVPKEAFLRIREVRKNKGLNLDTFAKQVGNSKGAFWLWENGKAIPSAETFSKLVIALGMTSLDFARVIRKAEPKTKQEPEVKIDGEVENRIIKMLTIEKQLPVYLKEINEAIEKLNAIKSELERLV